MPKTIVTHIHPDLDAIMAAWILVRFDQPGYGDARLEYVPAGSTYKGLSADLDPAIVHVDVGKGKYDHHKEGAGETCAAKLVYEDLVAKGKINPSDLPLQQMVEFALEIDLFQDFYWPEKSHYRYAFMLQEVIPALHRLQIYDNEAVTRMIFGYLDAVYQRLKDLRRGNEALEEGEEFPSRWGKGIAVETSADDVSKAALKQGYSLVVVKDYERGFIRIKLAPDSPYNLKPVYDKIIERESPAKWYYHHSGRMLLNGSDKGGLNTPSEMSVEEVVALIKSIK